jgi:hypothetical protein
MQLSKPPGPFAFLFVFLALSFVHFDIPNTQSTQPVERPVVTPDPTPPVLQVQTGRSESLEAIVPLERISRRAFNRSATVDSQQPEVLLTAEIPAVSPVLQKFIDEVSDGQAGVVRGVHVPGVFNLPVIQQPIKNAAFVSEENDTVTQFKSAAQYGVTGLLAHNYLAGELFYNIDIGQKVVIVMGDGAMREYWVTGIYQFRKISPNNLRSNLVDLSNGMTLTTAQVFSMFYRGDDKVTFQTCLEGEGKLNWGLTFIVADPDGY